MTDAMTRQISTAIGLPWLLNVARYASQRLADSDTYRWRGDHEMYSERVFACVSRMRYIGHVEIADLFQLEHVARMTAYQQQIAVDRALLERNSEPS